MTRSMHHRSLFVFVGVLLSCSVLPSGLSVHAGEQPDVLFVAVDDLNDWIGCLKGHPQALTPNIDRLAARGVLFTNAHCAATACNPSRAAVFSGRLPNVTGVWSNASGSLRRRYPKARLLWTAFSEAGYQTFGCGKLLHGRPKAGQTGLDEYYSTEQRWSPLSREAVRYTDAELPTKGSASPRHVVRDSRGREVLLPLNRMPSDRNPKKRDGESFDWGPFDVSDSEFGDTRITNWAIERLEGVAEGESDRPLFLAVGYYRPHIPLWAPKRFFDRFEETPGQLPPVFEMDLDDLSSTGRRRAREAVTAGSHATVVRHKQWRAAVEAYLACVSYVDYEIGRLLDALDRSPKRDSTWIVLWSDHGWHLGEKEHWGKWTGWERSTRVPLLIVPPRKSARTFAPAGARCHRPVGLVDLWPTLAELCDLDPPDGLDGVSLVSLLRDPDQRVARPALTLFDKGNATLRGERWRYIRYADGSEELYDYEADAQEWRNLIHSDSEPDRTALGEQRALLRQRAPFLFE